MKLTTAERSARYRAKDVKAFRKYKRELARTPKHKATRRAYMRLWRRRNRATYNLQAAIYNKQRKDARSPESRHTEHLKRCYGLSKPEYAAILKKQHGRCAICKCRRPGGRGRWVVDHCHTKGFIRGLLCNWCNTRLAWFEKNKQRSAKYLAKGPYRFPDGFRKAKPKATGSFNRRISIGVNRWWKERKAQQNGDL